MDIRTLFYNLREEVSCPVCSDLFKDPRQLPCLHSFCLHCLKHWHQTSGGQNAFRCPKCQALSRVPANGDLKDLPTSFYLNGMIDVLAIKECNTTQVTCGNCDKKSSEASYCFQCCMFYCEQCLIGHNMMRNNKDHRVLAVKEFQDKDYEDVLKRPVFCSKQGHQKKELEYVCKECETAVCQTCVILDHGGHTLKLIEEEAEAQKIEMTALIQEQRQNLQEEMNLITQLDEEYAKLIEQSENVKRNVDRFTDNLIKTIQAKRQNILAAVENETRKSGESVARTKTEIQKKITLIESSLEKADKLLTRSINAEVVQLKKSLAAILEEAEQAKHISRDPEYLQTVVFVENQKIENVINSEEIGFLEIFTPKKPSESIAEGKGLREATVGREAQLNLTTRSANNKQCYDKRDIVTVEMRDEHGQECVTKVQIDDNKDGIYNISYSPKVQGSCKLSIKVNGEHVRDSPFTVLVKPFHVKPVLSFGKEGSDVGMFKYPLEVAVSNRDEIAVADQSNHRVQIFNSNGDFIRSFGRYGSNQGEFVHPFGIGFDKDGKIFVADNTNHRVQIFNGEGRYMGMFGGKGSLDSQLYNPWGLSLDSQGNIIVADSGNKLIKIFSPDGNFLMKIGGPGSFSFPVHCVQCNEYLIVSDSGDAHNIKVFSREGEYKYKFGKRGGGDGEFTYPRCLSVTKSGLLMVCDKDNHRIQVFELNGKFVGKFGTKGSNLGEFVCPFSVAMLSNNQIVVCDKDNRRIQIFE